MTPQFGYWNILGVVNIIWIFGIKSTDIYFFQLGQSCRMLLHYNDTKYDNIVYHSGSTEWRVAKKIMFGTWVFPICLFMWMGMWNWPNPIPFWDIMDANMEFMDLMKMMLLKLIWCLIQLLKSKMDWKLDCKHW